MAIPFTQYLRPNGRTREDSIERPKSVEDLAHHLIGHGYRFEMELLRTGYASFECVAVQPDEHGDHKVIAHTICENGPAVLGAVDTLVRSAFFEFTKRGD